MPPFGIPRLLGVSINDLPRQLPGQISAMEALVRLDANGDGLLLLNELQRGFIRNTSAGAVARLFLAQPKSDQSDWLAALDGAAVGKLLAALSPEEFHTYLVQEISRWPDTSRGLIEAISTTDPKGLLGQRLRNSFKTLQAPQQLQLLLATESRWHKLFLTSLCGDPTDMRDLAYLFIRLPHTDANGQFGAMLFSQLGKKCSDQLIAYMDLNMYFANGQKSYRDYLMNAQRQADRLAQSGMTATYIPSPQLAAATIQKLQVTPVTLAADIQGAIQVAARGVTQNPGCTFTYYRVQGRYYGTVVPGTVAPALPPLPRTEASEIAALIATAPDPRPFFAQLGEHYYKAGNYGAALKSFEKALDKIGEVDPAPEFLGRAQYFLGKTLQQLPKNQHPEENLEFESFTGAMLWWKVQTEADAWKKEQGKGEQLYFQRHPDEEAMLQEALCYLGDKGPHVPFSPTLTSLFGPELMNSPPIQQLLKTPCDL